MSDPVWIGVDLAKGPDKTVLTVIRDGVKEIFDAQLASLQNLQKVLTEAGQKDKEMRAQLDNMSTRWAKSEMVKFKKMVG